MSGDHGMIANGKGLITMRFQGLMRFHCHHRVAPELMSIFILSLIKILHAARSRNPDVVGVTHMVSDLVWASCEQIMMVLEKVTVWIFFIVTSKLKTLLFCNPQITGE